MMDKDETCRKPEARSLFPHIIPSQGLYCDHPVTQTAPDMAPSARNRPETALKASIPTHSAQAVRTRFSALSIPQPAATSIPRRWRKVQGNPAAWRIF